MIHLPTLKRIYKLALVPTWLLGSFATLAIGALLLTRSYSNVSQTATSSSNLSGSSAALAEGSYYGQFASLPDVGKVLGQSVGIGDQRVSRLYNYLNEYGSPLAIEAPTLVRKADEYGLPWALLPAIAGKESGFGRAMPYNSYNAWGWAIYAGKQSGASFSSFEHAIDTVAKGLKEDYFNKGKTTPATIEPTYTPQSAARDNSWKNGVEFFMAEIEEGV